MDREKKNIQFKRKQLEIVVAQSTYFIWLFSKSTENWKKKKKKTQKEQNKKNQIQINWEHLKCLIMIRDKRHV